ncbi:hypothetical protein TSOC_015163, partial [Tetrabaena socialis]
VQRRLLLPQQHAAHPLPARPLLQGAVHRALALRAAHALPRGHRGAGAQLHGAGDCGHRGRGHPAHLPGADAPGQERHGGGGGRARGGEGPAPHGRSHAHDLPDA